MFIYNVILRLDCKVSLFFCRFLAEIGALIVVDDHDMSSSLKDLYEKIGKEKTGCCWQLFEVYRHLKSLGYVVGRHGVAWTVKVSKDKHVKTEDYNISHPEKNKVIEFELREEHSVVDLFDSLQIRDEKLVFSVYLPNSKFKKSSPGEPSFVIYLTG